MIYKVLNTYASRKSDNMPVSEKQKDYARKWDKENMHTISTRVRMEEFKDYKAWCEMRGVTVTSEIKRFVMSELDKYYAELDRLPEELEKQLPSVEDIESRIKK